jgi:hypothetical protein
MKVRDTLQRDPAVHQLVNNGQARIDDKTNDKALEELKGELSTFVCEGQFADGMQRIVSSYLRDLGQTSQKPAWVSGFFGSGKSHLLKMLAHLWQDTQFPDGSTARSTVPSLPEELRHLLRELDTAGRRAGGLLAAAGTLPSGTTDRVRLTVIGVLLRAVGLPDQYAPAQFCLWLHEQGYLGRVKAAVEAAGKTWSAELNNLYVSGHIARALIECEPHFSASEAEARKTIREQFPQRTSDITTAEFLSSFKRALKLVGRDGKFPSTVLILDEVQQYIGDSSECSTFVTEVAEAVSKQLDSQVILVGAGQSALTDVPLLHKLMDRFPIRVALSDADVETVTRKVLLQKKPTAIGAVRDSLDTHAGEISRQLQGTRLAETVEDRHVIVDDYPLLPVRRRFWEHCFRQIDAAGTHSQLRSQLKIIHDAVAKLSDKPLGAVVPADELFEALAPEMVNTGVLLRELNERIINLSKDGTDEGKLARRICGLVFLIGKLPRDAGADLGVRATREHIADLLVDGLQGDNGKLRSAVAATLERLASQGALMRVGEEYRLQTKEGSEWDREYRNRQTKLANDDATVQVRRDALLYAESDRIVRAVRLLQGSAKEPRPLSLHREQTPPPVSDDSVPVWVRDGWSCSEKEVLEAARVAGSSNPLIQVFIPRQSAEDLRRLVIQAEAADQTLSAKGLPTTPEGLEARRSMESRRDLAVRERDELVGQIVANAKVFQGGGSELLQLALGDKLREAAEASLVRLFPRFKEADSAAWAAVIKRARDGADQPFQAVGHAGGTEQHPVCQQVLATVGAGKNGNEVRKDLRTSPFGWPQDAIDAALIALHRTQHLSATLNGTPVQPGQLDQNRISKTEFRREQAVLSVGDRLALRRLYTLLGVPCKAGEEALKAPEFLVALEVLAVSAGGQPPLPPPPSVAEVEDLKKLVGNDQLSAIRQRAVELEARIAEWHKAKDLVAKRKPGWDITERLARHAAGLAKAADSLAQAEAIRRGRLLLEPTDPVAPVRSALADVLRQALKDAQAQYQDAYATAMATLGENETWLRVSEAERAAILKDVGLATVPTVDASTDAALLAGLETRSLPTWETEYHAVAGRMQLALEMAATRLEPRVRMLSLERATLHSEAEVRRWLERQEKRLIEAVKDGPVLVS